MYIIYIYNIEHIYYIYYISGLKGRKIKSDVEKKSSKLKRGNLAIH